MKAKYRYYGSDCIIYEQAICEDNIFVRVRSYYGSWCSEKPEVTTKVCLTHADARRLFYGFCNECEKEHYDCQYKEYGKGEER